MAKSSQAAPNISKLNKQFKSSAAKRREFEEAQRQHSDNHKFGGKKPLPGPTHVGNFLMMLAMKVCRSILFIDTSVKIGVYLIGVMIGSIICDLFVVPRTFLTESRNPLNAYFVKLGWAWTLLSVGLYLLLTSFIYCCQDLVKMCQHLMRLVVGTFWWYVCTSFFVHIESQIGVCTHDQHTNKTSCVGAGQNWLGFDISGHVFLEIHCLLIISEEIKTFKEWKRLREILHSDSLKSHRSLPEERILQAQINYDVLTPLIKVVVLLLAVIMVLFEFMLLVSTVYRFHTLSQKVTASFVAVTTWFLSYRVLFQSGSPYPFVPVMPGQSYLNFVKIK